MNTPFRTRYLAMSAPKIVRARLALRLLPGVAWPLKVFLPLNRQAISFIQPSPKIDFLATVRTKRHGRVIRREKLFTAYGTSDWQKARFKIFVSNHIYTTSA